MLAKVEENSRVRSETIDLNELFLQLFYA